LYRHRPGGVKPAGTVPDCPKTLIGPAASTAEFAANPAIINPLPCNGTPFAHP
jgi:hypothetical protein